MLESYSYNILWLLFFVGLALIINGIRETRKNIPTAVFYFSTGLFLILAHIFFLDKAPNTDLFSFTAAKLNLFLWIDLFLTRSVIVLLIVFGIFRFFRVNYLTGLIQIFFALTLILFLYVVGINWAISYKSMLTLFYFLTFAVMELKVDRFTKESEASPHREQRQPFQ